MPRPNRKRIIQYVVAVVAVFVALFATKMMARIDQKPVLFVFLGAVMVAASVGGLLPGLLALALSGALSAYYVIAPIHSFELDGIGSAVRWVAFQLIGLLIVSLHASRRAVAEQLSETDQRLRLAMDAGRIGVWDYSLETGDLWLSNGIANLLGQSEWFKPTFPEFLELVHPEDRELFHQTVLRTIADRVDYEVDFRILRPDGSTRWLVTRGRGYIAASSGGQRIVGVISENASNRSPNANSAQNPGRAAEERAVKAAV